MKLFLLASLLVPTFVFAQKPVGLPPSFRTYVAIETVSEQTSVEITLPGEKSGKAAKAGEKFEISAEHNKTDGFHVIVQMSKNRGTILPCQIDVAQLTSFDRSYICSTQDPEKVVQAQVQVRVYTTLHGGDKITPKKFVARK
jgi:hypothetical protein